MASTNKTANLELSQFIGSDKPDFLTDYNGDMLKIDNNFASVQTAAQEAESHAQAAADSARDAQDTANQAQKDVEGAYTVANNATTLATEAKAQSDSAVHIAESAMQSAASALTVANAAQGTANEAKQKAESLETAIDIEKSERETAITQESTARIETDEEILLRLQNVENDNGMYTDNGIPYVFTGQSGETVAQFLNRALSDSNLEFYRRVNMNTVLILNNLFYRPHELLNMSLFYPNTDTVAFQCIQGGRGNDRKGVMQIKQIVAVCATDGSNVDIFSCADTTFKTAATITQDDTTTVQQNFTFSITSFANDDAENMKLFVNFF